MTDLDPRPVLDALARDPQLQVFLADGRIETMPARQSRRRLMLDQIAQAFEPGIHYSEQNVSDFLGSLHPDYATLRRYLVDEEFLSRKGGQYWRSGGTVPPSPEPGQSASGATPMVAASHVAVPDDPYGADYRGDTAEDRQNKPDAG